MKDGGDYWSYGCLEGGDDYGEEKPPPRKNLCEIMRESEQKKTVLSFRTHVEVLNLLQLNHTVVCIPRLFWLPKPAE